MPSALIVVDMVSSYDFPDAEKLVGSVRETLPNIQRLIERARDEDVRTIYVNDNYGRWNSSREEILREARESPYAELVEDIAPDEDTAFIFKGRHSVFYQTPLEHLLKQEGIDRIVLAGQVTEQCILYSALDAYLRELNVAVPRDATAHIIPDLAEAAYEMMKVNMDADISESGDIDLQR